MYYQNSNVRRPGSMEPDTYDLKQPTRVLNEPSWMAAQWTRLSWDHFYTFDAETPSSTFTHMCFISCILIPTRFRTARFPEFSRRKACELQVHRTLKIGVYFPRPFPFKWSLAFLCLSERVGHIPRTSLMHSLMWKSCTDSARAQSYDAYEVGLFLFN